MVFVKALGSALIPKFK